MRTRLAPLFVAAFAALAATGTGVPVCADVPSADAIFARAKDAWRVRHEVPLVTYNLRERYDWRGRTHDNWWSVAYRDADRALALRRVIVAEDEARRLKGAAIGINLHIHNGVAKADSLDTNANADAFPILDPQIGPNAAFGLIRRERKAALVGTASPFPGASDAAATAATPVPLATPPAASTPVPLQTEKPLRELARVEAVARDYKIVLAGTERVWGSDTYHLTLEPLHEPRVYRLRDLWVDTGSYATVQLAMQGLFEGKPYDDARWIVGYIVLGGRTYVRQIRTDDNLRFGLDRTVTGLTFDFVAYEFPPSLPTMTFQRLL